MEYLDHDKNKAVAVIIIQSILKNDTRIATADEVCFSLGLASSFSILYWCDVSLLRVAGWRIVWTDKGTYQGFWRANW